MKKFILTVGPALSYAVNLSRIHDERNIYRINGAHGALDDIEQSIANIRQQVPSAKILLDMPGNKIRTSNLAKGVSLEKGKTFELRGGNFNYPDFYRHLTPGMTVWANDSVFEFEVVSAGQDKIVFLSKSDGLLQNNKGMHVRGIHTDIPFLFEKDRRLIDLANSASLDYVGLSFVRTAENIREAMSIINPKIKIISKIETLDAVRNINQIMEMVKYILVDRGDLATDIGLHNIPRFQQFIIDKALYFGVRVFLATQILKTMETKPIPTIAEMEALYDIFKKGVYGVQMSEETAVGQYPEECVALLARMDEQVSAESISLIV